MRFFRDQAQSVAEYVILVSVIIAFCIGMFPMVKRGTQSLIRVSTDQIGSQLNAEQSFNVDEGYLIGSNTVSNMVSTTVRSALPGLSVIEAHDTVQSQTSSKTGLGFTED